jgi:uncharacterized protein involved in exopolysaccharide biosynthesis
VLLFVATLLLVSACGKSSSSSSSHGTSTEEWAGGLCTAITSWTTSITQTGNSLRGGSMNQDKLQQAAEDFRASTHTLAEDLKGLGKPDTDAGQEAKASVDKLAGQIQADADKIQQTVKGVSGLTGVQAALTTIAGTLTQMSSQLTSTFTELGSLDSKGELQDAFKKAPACSSLVKTAG